MIRAALILALIASPAFATTDLRIAARGDTPASAAAASTDAAKTASQPGPLGELNGLFSSDFAAAAKLATSTSIKDGNGLACWTAFQPLGEVINAHPELLTGRLATDIEAKRLAVIAARNLCNNVACNTVFTEEASMAQGFVKNLPVSLSINVTPINLFAQACAAIPTLQVAPLTAGAP
jgi:hypothetical protein